jgi:hypothetical protein
MEMARKFMVRKLRLSDSGLEQLLSVDAEGQNLWSSEDLADILRHQLCVPLVFDLSRVHSGLAGDSSLFTSNPIQTFRDLFQHPSPPQELLVLAKDFAKSARVDPDNPLPPEVATVLYYSSIAAALLRHQSRITSMSDSEFIDGATWVQNQSWIDEETKSLMGEATAKASSHGAE